MYVHHCPVVGPWEGHFLLRCTGSASVRGPQGTQLWKVRSNLSQGSCWKGKGSLGSPLIMCSRVGAPDQSQWPGRLRNLLHCAYTTVMIVGAAVI